MSKAQKSFEKYQFSLRLFLDILSTILAWFLSYFLRFYILPGARRDSLGLFTGLSLLAILSTLVFLFSFKMYDNKRTSSRRLELEGIFKVSLSSFLTFVVVYYYMFSLKVSRVALVIYALMLFTFLLFGRSIAHALILKKANNRKYDQRALLVGYGKRLTSYYNAVIAAGDSERIRFVGQYLGKETIGDLEQIEGDSLEEVVKANNIDFVVISFPSGSEKRESAVHEGLELLNADVYLLPNIPNSYAGSKIRDFHSIPTVQLNSSELSLGKRFVKRTFDIISCSLAVILLSPLYLLLAALVKFTSKGPVFFRQKRVTRDGKVFEMLKFRSMRIDMPEQNGPHFTEENDPRITKIGRILRKTSLDEIPQFFNVLGGSMSLIGPRPERPELVEEFKKTIPGYDLRHKVKAGISGWAQVNGLRGNTSIEKRVAYDLNYVMNWSFFLDMKIVILTFFKGFINKNAY